MVNNEFSAEDLRDWQKDNRGEPFWEELRDMFANRISGLRTTSKKGESVNSAFLAGEIAMIEEVLQLPDVIIQEDILAKEDKKKESEESD